MLYKVSVGRVSRQLPVILRALKVAEQVVRLNMLMSRDVVKVEVEIKSRWCDQVGKDGAIMNVLLGRKKKPSMASL
jgi:hypothetical protein